MAVAATKHMASNFAKLDKFEGNVELQRTWDPLRPKMAEDASSKKFLISKHNLETKERGVNPVTMVWVVHLRIGGVPQGADSDKPKKATKVVGPSVINRWSSKNSSMYKDEQGTIVHVCKEDVGFKTYEVAE
ncbi:hypothetical protein Tco_1125229 [Tanacetum coccineum]|uniref:Uncharacterized protein n=1 Tax=Tanacetum coccineum TaxID=301880 RepID=A0ABQ5J8F8_9ASTR